jgi:CelD/BcsL family acetyltransferase involved in cellulose biosynthesis
MPMRDRGGVVARDDAVARALVDRAARLTTELGARYLELKGSAPMPDLWLEGADWRIDRESWVTTRLDLRPGADALWKALSKKNTRWSIKKADKNGVRIALDSSEEGMRTFHRLFVQTRCAMGIPPYPAALFLAIHRHLVRSGRAQLLLAHRDDMPVHGLLSFLSKDTFVPAYAAPQKHFGKLYATEAILWHSIEWAAQNGFVSYDFGADSKLQAGLFAFKRKWGGVQHPMAYHYLLNGISEPPSFDSSGPAYRLVRALWQRLPVALARPLGGWVTRQLS